MFLRLLVVCCVTLSKMLYPFDNYKHPDQETEAQRHKGG